MFDLTSVVSLDGLNHKFIRMPVNTQGVVPSSSDGVTHNGPFWNVVTGETSVILTDSMLEKLSTDQTTMGTDFAKFKDHPTYWVGKPLSEDEIQGENNCEIFDRILTGAMILQMGEEQGIKYAKRCIEWLRGTDFYIAPASTVYHESEPKGLLHHTLRVINKIVEISSLPTYKNVKLEEAVIAAIAHDFCKIGMYEMYTRNVKNEQTGQWEKVPSYKRREPKVPFGHGTSSMWIAQKFFKLTTEMGLAIRWHMGAFYKSDGEMDDLNYANTKYPMVLMLQFADLLAINRYDTNEEFISTAEFKTKGAGI